MAGSAALILGQMISPPHQSVYGRVCRQMMMRIENESADLIAANAVRLALANYPAPRWNSVEHAVVTLIAHHRIEERTAQYVLDNSDQFTLCPKPRLFDARWHLEADSVSC